MKLGHAFKGQRVCYVPNHANGDLAHPDCECGTVLGVVSRHVFVNFDRDRAKGRRATGELIAPADLHEINERFEPKP